MILDEVLNELFGFGEKKKPEAYKGDIGKPFPGTEEEYKEAALRFINNKKGKYCGADELYLFELYVFGYTDSMCSKIATSKNNLYGVNYNDTIEEVFFDEDEDAIRFFKKNKLGELSVQNSVGYVYSPGTHMYYFYAHDDHPVIDIKKPINFQKLMSLAKEYYEDLMKEYSI